jgi:Fe-S cluster assembly protein SufD
VTMEAVARENDLSSAAAAAFEEKRLDGEPEWLCALRRDAFARFTALGFPTTKNEAWKYTSVAPIAKTPFRLADGVGRLDRAPHPLPLPGLSAEAHSAKVGGEGARIVFINGRYAPQLSRGAFGTAVVVSLREALEDDSKAVQPHLGKTASFERDAFTALNTAFLEDGAFVVIPRGSIVSEPVHLLFLSAGDGEPVVSHPRNLIVAESNSQARIVETYMGDGTYFTNAVTEVVCGDGAVLEHYKLQREGASALHVQTLAVAQGRASRFDSHNLCLGAALARTDIDVLFQAEGGECALNGLFVTAGSQHVDNHTLIDHARPHCTSRELYKGILDGRSRGVFHGKIIVRPDAQKTDAIQTNKNLLLSREALVNSTPALEILADDVKCRHGSTIGQLDAAALFYLRARGIGEEDARSMLTYGFAADLASRIRVPWVREEIEGFLAGRLARPSEVP